MDWLSGPVAIVASLLQAQLFAEPIGGQTYVGRVEPWPPRQPVAPCAWLEVAAGTRGFDDALWETAVDVVLCVDGEGPSAFELLYALGDRCIAIITSPSAQRQADLAVTAARSVSLDVGGPNLRGLVVTITVAMPAPSLCPSAQLIGAANG
jgi:hypothetical protein